MSVKEPPAFILKIAKPRYVLLLLLLFVVFSGGIMPSLEADIKALSGGVGVIDLELFYWPEKARMMVDAYGAEGRHLYLIAQWTVDLVFPVIAGLFFATALVALRARRWWWLGFWVTLADWMENVWVTWLLLDEKGFSTTVAILSCFFTVLKWSGIFAGNLIILWSLIQLFKNKRGQMAKA
ncbi:MAG: hypothetical protein J0M29_13775 [Chitinophagales bacterium]|nr:hypothetical protein [Chitinophagales bacterium]